MSVCRKLAFVCLAMDCLAQNHWYVMAWVPWTDVTGIEGIVSAALFCYITMIYRAVEVFDLQLLWQCYGSLQDQRRLFPQPSGPQPVGKGIEPIKTATIRNNGIFDLTSFEANASFSKGKPYQTCFVCVFCFDEKCQEPRDLWTTWSQVLKKTNPTVFFAKRSWQQIKSGIGRLPVQQVPKGWAIIPPVWKKKRWAPLSKVMHKACLTLTLATQDHSAS